MLARSSELVFPVFVKLKLIEQALVDQWGGGSGSSDVRYGTSAALDL